MSSKNDTSAAAEGAPAPNDPSAAIRNATAAGGTKPARARAIAWVSAMIAVTGGAATLLGNTQKLAGPLASVGLFVGERGAAAALHQEAIRTRIAKSALAKVHPDGIACFARAVPIDLDGDGVKADLAVGFQRTPRPGRCKDLDAPEDVAFFASGWNGYRYLGDPELPAAITAWNFAGPAAFREQADSAYPFIHIYMQRGDRIAEVGTIDTASSGDYTGSQYIEAKDGRSAWVVNAAAITKVGLASSGKPLIQRVDGKALVAENQGLHLLAFDASGHLALDGDPSLVQPGRTAAVAAAGTAVSDPANPSDGDRFTIRLAPGYHLYLVGCSPEFGLSQTPAEPGAFAVDFTKTPSVRCPLGEDTRSFVDVQPKDY